MPDVNMEVEVQYRQLIPKLSIIVTPETGFIPIGSGEKNPERTSYYHGTAIKWL